MNAQTDLYCPRCKTKIHEKGDELGSLIFPRQEERCSQCSMMLRRRTGGGQHNPWNFTTLAELNKKDRSARNSMVRVRESVLDMLRRLQGLPPEEIYNSIKVMIDVVENPDLYAKHETGA